MNFLKEKWIRIGESAEGPFLKRNGIRQDGTTPMHRDVDGKLWAMSGHSHLGHIGMFCGTCAEDLVEVYPISTNFCVGHADYAYSGIRYPEGVKARGSIWPFGLYICPSTHRFFCFFHNECGWNGKGTAYDALGPCDTPHYDSDFRHIGLMHSDDEGKNWTFDRWVVTSERVCFTELYNPGAGNALGQRAGEVWLGSGDFSMYLNPCDGYIYLFYNIVKVDTNRSCWTACDTYVARTRARNDGIMGDFVKYYDGAFGEPGNFGKESPVFCNSWHTRVAYFEKYGTYVATSSPMNFGNSEKLVADYMQARTSTDLLHWSDPVEVFNDDGTRFGNHYMAIVSKDAEGNPAIVRGDEFVIMTNHNGTDVTVYQARIEEKDV